MSRRRLILPAGLAVGLIVWAGCQSRVNPVPTTPGSSVATSPIISAGCGPPSSHPRGKDGTPEQVAASTPAVPLVKPLRISPEAFTITPDDSGLQLLAAQDDGGSPRDVTTQVEWTVEPPDLAKI